MADIANQYYSQAGVDRKVAKDWDKADKTSVVPSINIQDSTILESGSICGEDKEIRSMRV
ncbi:2778_t:CDS:2 [Paraglomus brasilianum]|uniref:2778_t:CDS:1 n=1 Tax=Paraglomus brasilianum TaxID=144538 RepID=A0A9N9CJ62_9GLOM|nr:2778_t:CDS:2 [Paraglomus brasilianum]